MNGETFLAPTHLCAKPQTVRMASGNLSGPFMTSLGVKVSTTR